MRVFACLLACFAASLLALPAHAEEPPAPRMDRVDYDNPKSNLAMGTKVGAGQRTLGIAGQIVRGGKASQGSLGKILRWADRNLRSGKDTPAWRTMDKVVQQGRVHSDGDRAYAIGALARAAGIPTAWVKAVSVAWLRAATPGAKRPADATRTFLEVHLDGSWQLLDPATARLYSNYDRRRVLFPGGYLAYDKGSDPYALVLDNRPQLFDAQLAKFVSGFDVRRLPWSTSRDLLAPWRVHVTGKSGGATYAKEAARTLGYKVERSFDGKWDANLAKARGGTLIVTTRAGRPVLPTSYHDAWLPKGWKSAAQGGKTWHRGTLNDGTVVIVLFVEKYGPVELAVSEALEG